MTVAETSRLLIRNFNLEDIDDYYQIVSDSDVMRFIGDGNPKSRLEAALYVKNCIKNFDEKGWSRFAVIDKSTKVLMGFCGFANYNGELDFGWRYAKSFWGKGYGTEAANAVLHLGMHKFNFQRIVCIVYPENIASIRIIEKIGMVFEKEIRLNNKIVKQYVSVKN